MPAPSTNTMMHFRNPARPLGPAVCGEDHGWRTSSCGDVTCFACRKAEIFKANQLVGGGGPTPLSEVIANDPELAELNVKAVNAAAKNHRGMFVIEEVIHHGDYRSQRIVEVYAINVATVDAVLQSSAYAYGSWLHPENPAHTKARRAMLVELVSDLLNGRTNRSIGWSTFRLITNHT